jgi:hypothetical protein
LPKKLARSIQKIYNVNPLLCAMCSGSIRIILLIDDAKIIKKVLTHLYLWDVKHKPPPCANDQPPETIIIYDQSSAFSAENYIIDIDYPIEAYLKKNLAAGTPTIYARICRKAQFQLKKSILTTTSTSVSSSGIGSAQLPPQDVGLRLIPVQN